MSRFTAQRGNILFLILLAVVLFAALSYAVTQGMRGGGNDASNEKSQANAAELMNYFAQLDGAVQRMMMTGGVKDYELNFYYQSSSKFVSGANDNTNCTDSRCRVFDPAGGGVSGRALQGFTRTGSGSAGIYYISVPNLGTSAPDIVIALHAAATNICLEVNKRFGLNDLIYNSAAPANTDTLMYSNPLPTGPIPDTGNVLTNIPMSAVSAGTFCSCQYANLTSCETLSSIRPIIFHVLVAR